MGIHRDWTRHSKVVWCDCGWSDVGVDAAAARSLMADHEARAHPQDWQVRKAAAERERYHAAKPGNAE